MVNEIRGLQGIYSQQYDMIGNWAESVMWFEDDKGRSVGNAHVIILDHNQRPEDDAEDGED